MYPSVFFTDLNCFSAHLYAMLSVACLLFCLFLSKNWASQSAEGSKPCRSSSSSNNKCENWESQTECSSRSQERKTEEVNCVSEEWGSRDNGHMCSCKCCIPRSFQQETACGGQCDAASGRGSNDLRFDDGEPEAGSRRPRGQGTPYRRAPLACNASSLHSDDLFDLQSLVPCCRRSSAAESDDGTSLFWCPECGHEMGTAPCRARLDCPVTRCAQSCRNSPSGSCTYESVKKYLSLIREQDCETESTRSMNNDDDERTSLKCSPKKAVCSLDGTIRFSEADQDVCAPRDQLSESAQARHTNCQDFGQYYCSSQDESCDFGQCCSVGRDRCNERGQTHGTDQESGKPVESSHTDGVNKRDQENCSMKSSFSRDQSCSPIIKQGQSQENTVLKNCYSYGRWGPTMDDCDRRACSVNARRGCGRSCPSTLQCASRDPCPPQDKCTTSNVCVCGRSLCDCSKQETRHSDRPAKSPRPTNVPNDGPARSRSPNKTPDDGPERSLCGTSTKDNGPVRLLCPTKSPCKSCGDVVQINKPLRECTHTEFQIKSGLIIAELRKSHVQDRIKNYVPCKNCEQSRNDNNMAYTNCEQSRDDNSLTCQHCEQGSNDNLPCQHCEQGSNDNLPCQHCEQGSNDNLPCQHCEQGRNENKLLCKCYQSRNKDLSNASCEQGRNENNLSCQLLEHSADENLSFQHCEQGKDEHLLCQHCEQSINDINLSCQHCEKSKDENVLCQHCEHGGDENVSCQHCEHNRSDNNLLCQYCEQNGSNNFSCQHSGDKNVSCQHCEQSGDENLPCQQCEHSRNDNKLPCQQCEHSRNDNKLPCQQCEHSRNDNKLPCQQCEHSGTDNLQKC